jgi:periplasmic protein TonB
MSHDLFGAVATGAAKTPAARSRKSTVVLVSVGAHTLAIFTLGAIQLGHEDRWPTPREVLAFYNEPRMAPPADIELPLARRRSRGAAPDSPRPATSVKNVASIPSPATPLTAPSGITDASQPTSTPVGPGIENGTRGLLENTGIKSEPPAAPTAPTPIRLHSGIRVPQKIVHVAPLYPSPARASRVQGIVIIEATIDVHGNVESARILRSIALLDQAALDAVTRWKFSPTLLNGVAVPIVMTVTVNFTLN